MNSILAASTYLPDCPLSSRYVNSTLLVFALDDLPGGSLCDVLDDWVPMSSASTYVGACVGSPYWFMTAGTAVGAVVVSSLVLLTVGAFVGVSSLCNALYDWLPVCPVGIPVGGCVGSPNWCVGAGVAAGALVGYAMDFLAVGTFGDASSSTSLSCLFVVISNSTVIIDDGNVTLVMSDDDGIHVHEFACYSDTCIDYGCGRASVSTI